MSHLNHFVLLATYNRWMNAKVYETAGKLSAAELAANKGAFFGSVLGTLNHLMVADRAWLLRFAALPAQHPALEPVRQMPKPTSLDQILYEDFHELAAERKALDEIILAWTNSLTDFDLEQVLEYKSIKGMQSRRQFASVLQHFFNHQTHHRGQTTTLLSQAGLDVGVTDLLMLIPEADY